MADIPKLIGKALEFGAIFMDREITLLNRAKLGFKEDSAFELVVTKVTLDIRPEGEGCDVWFVDKIEDIGGYGGVNPVDKATVNLPPLRSALGNRRGRSNMIFEAELAKNRIETAAPLAVVRGGVIEHDRDVVADIDRLENGSGGWLRRGIVVGLVGIRVGGSKGMTR
jgi:hypothetical protein